MKNGLLLALTVLLLSSKLYASKFEVRWEKGSKKILMDRDNSQAEYNGSSSQYRFYVADTLTHDTIQLRLYQIIFREIISTEYSVYFSHDYIKVKHGDLKDIFTLDGKLLFRSAHCENSNNYTTPSPPGCAAAVGYWPMPKVILCFTKEKEQEYLK